MPRINPLLPQTAVLFAEQLQHQRWVPVDECQKVGAAQAEQRNRRHRCGITAVALGAIHQIFVEKQFTGTKADAVQLTAAQLHPSAFNHMDELHWLAGAKHAYAGWKRQQVHLGLFLDEFQRSQRS